MLALGLSVAVEFSSPSPDVQLTEAGVIEDVFSLCFGGVSGGGALLMGDVPLPPGS